MCVLADTHRQTRTHMDSHGRPVCADRQPRTASNVMCVLADTHGCPVCTEQTAHVGQKSPKQSTGRTSVLSPWTNVLICVLMDSHGRPVCSDGHTQTATDVLCVLADTHGRPVCTEQTAHVGQNSPKHSTRRASVLSPRTNVLICVLMDSDRRPVCADRHTRTHTDSHGRPVFAGGHPRTSCV